MYLASVISFFCVLIYLFFGLNVYKANPKAPANRVFLILCLNFTMAALFSMFQYSALSLEACLFWNALHLPFSFLNVGLLMHFHIVLCKKNKQPLWVYLLAYLPSIYFIGYIVSGRDYLGDFALGPYGWYPRLMAPPLISVLNVAIFSLFLAIELILLIRYRRRSRSQRIKRQALALIHAMVLSFAVSGAYNALVLGRGLPLPLLPFALQLIWIAGIWFSLKRYDFLGLSISFASRQIISHINEMLVLCDAELNLAESNERFRAVSGYAEDEALSLVLGQIFIGEELNALVLRLQSGREQQGSVEAFMRSSAGKTIPVMAYASTLRDKIGELEGLIFVAEDLRPLKQLEVLNAKHETLLNEKKVLLAEVHHRIKNNMATIRAILNLQASASDIPEAAAAISDAENRVLSMAVLYDKLYRADSYRQLSCDSYLSPLVDEILQNMPVGADIRVEKKLGDFDLPADALLPLGIIINELITNALKYAFKGRASGTIYLGAESSEGTIRIEIADDGVGLPEHVDIGKSPGFGLSMIESMAKQLGGSVSLRRGERTAFIIELNAAACPA
jgi:PAS domain S-box-containing protein